jgi:hypothetical protein
MIPDLKPELKSMIDGISRRNTYYGNKISDSIMRMLIIEETELNCGVIAPYWLGVLQRGRGPRKSTTSHGLINVIYKWMSKRGMFRSLTEKGKLNEARYMTWYINKFGNQQFRNKTFVDIYESERKIAIENINKKFVSQIDKITMDIL